MHFSLRACSRMLGIQTFIRIIFTYFFYLILEMTGPQMLAQDALCYMATDCY
ncbi:hypothetical protein B0I21_107238 [Sphingobacterium paludis]|uniref:Uncharacterized protein n=1 Tax=Sphingobacterium paludis TaxID=1476465 RepID=A0A4R7CZC0_9SPHI|nr:hypothetical protein B0I21_107238 [Sphingobacterium paludis]